MVKAYTKNLYASEVYRELERQAVRKGHFTPTPEELVKSAAHQVTVQRNVNKPISAAPTEDLVQDVARLAFAMRRKGFIAQAEDLEQKLVVYKQAETALYDVTSESNSDLMDQAHPDGDVEIIEGSGEPGQVETVESAAAKIRSMVGKTPTGKLAALNSLYKKANSLYGVTSETNADFIEFSHPDGDVEIVEGTGELGKVETIESMAAKIRAVVRKEPTGNLPKNASLSQLADLIKKAQSGDEFADAPQASGTGTKTETDEKVTGSIESTVGQVKKQLEQIALNFDKISTVNFDDAMTTFLHGQGGKSSAFISLGGDYKPLDRYGAMYKAAYRGGEPNQNTIKAILINDPYKANTYLQSIGVNEKVAKALKHSLTKNAQMGPAGPAGYEQQYIAEMKKKVEAQADQIASSVETQIKKQEQLALEQVNKVKDNLKVIKDRALKVSERIKQWAGWSTDNLRDIRNFWIQLSNSVGPIKTESDKIKFILNGFGLADASRAIDQGIELLSGSLKSLGSSVEKMAGANVRDTLGRLQDIQARLTNLVKDDDPKKPKHPKEKKTLELVNSMIASIKENQTKGERAILEAIKGYKTWKDFDVDTMQLLEMIKGIEAKSSEAK